jgi:hypothetical protein
VCLRVSRDGGKTFAPEVAIPRAPGESQSWPQIDFAPDGGFVLVYASKTGDQIKILTRRLDAQDKPREEAIALSHPNVPCGEPQIACDKSGRLCSVWREGDSEDSEVWLARCPADGQPWAPATQMTNDKAYSEYPLVWLEHDLLFMSYHSDLSGLADLKYVRQSKDNGDTWGEPVAQPSLENVAGRAWVEINFALQYARSSYHPHDTTVFLNGVQIGKLEHTIPEGTYVWEAPPGVADCGAAGIRANHIRVKVDGLNGANYILAGKCRLIVQRRYTQLPVVASSQAEADTLAQSGGTTLNHAMPDLALAANAIAGLPNQLSPGQKIELPPSRDLRTFKKAPKAKKSPKSGGANTFLF